MSKKLLNLCMVALMSVASTAAWALSEVNGFYQIGSAEDFAAFTQLVNGGTRDANAVLTADINLGAITTQIGTGGDYQGLFDGAGHTLTIALPDRTDGEGPALFRGIGNRGIVQNLKVQGTITTGTSKHTAAIANYSAGLIRSCFVDLVITSTFAADKDASIGGIAGQLNRPAVIENCLSKIKILGETTHKCGGLAAWVDAQRINIANCLVINDPETNIDYSDGKSAGLVRDGDNLLKTVNLTTYNADSYKNRPEGANGNNYVTNDWGKLSTGTTVVTPEEVASGKVCYQLNSDQSYIGWVQNEGDAFPVPAVFGAGKGQMYASAATNCQGMAAGELTFSNSGTVQATAHTFDKYGICTTCGQFNWNCFKFEDATRFEPATKSVLLGSDADLYLAEGWNRLQNGFKLNMKMVNDISCTPPTGQLIFNSNDWMDSNFDGGGHTLTINLAEITESNAAFIPQFDGNFENVIMHGSIGTNQNHAASISGYFHGNGQKIRNVFSDITINTKKTGDNTCGGLAGIDGPNTTFENCIYAGDIIGVPGTECLGGFAGWANGTTYYKNCAFIGTMTYGGGDSHAISRNNGNANCTNVYSTFKNGSDLNKYTLVTSDDVGNGRLCYMLNGKQGGVERFYQLLGTDPMPMPFAKEGALVYATAYCGEAGNPAGCTNTATNPTVVDHPYVDGWCSVCGKMQEGYMSPVNGWYEISTPGQLAWWSNDAANNTTKNARLNADIDMAGYSKYYVPVGKDGSLFVGEFDGQGHTLSNLNITGGDYTGVFGRIGGGAKIKNVVLDNTCSITGISYCGIAGGTNGSGDVYLMNLGNEGNVTGYGANVCGIIGVDMSGSANLHISNCYVTGAVKGVRESATICGWSNGSSVIENCYSIASLEGIYSDGSFTRGGGAVLNCYELNTYGKQASTKKVTAEEVASGALCYQLNGDQTTINWYQNLDTNADAYPLPFSSHAQVYANASYTCNGKPKGDVVYANVNDEHHDSHTEENGFCSKCGTMLSYVADYMTPAADGYYEIADNKQMRWFAASVNNGSVPTNTNARLMADIDFTDIMDYAPIGKEGVLYSGTFDGQGHALSNLVIESDENYIGVFGRIGDGANIKNFVLESTCSIKGNAFCGIVGGTNNGGNVYLSNLGNEGTVTSTAQNAAGILGVDMGGSATLHITNCYVTGAVKGHHESATICAWSNDQSVVENCYSTASLDGIYETGSFTRGQTAIVNCYEIEGVGLQNNVNKVTATEVTSGALAYKLNGNTNDGETWTQTIAPDSHPVLFGSGQAVHQASAGNFTNLPVADEKIQIADAANLKKFAAEVNAGNVTSDAVLTADIDLSEVITGNAWTSIGNNNLPYKGTFDGQKHTIANITYTATGQYNGLFGKLSTGAVVKNFTAEGTMAVSNTVTGRAVALIAVAGDGNVLIQNINSKMNYNNALAGAQVGGVLGGALNGNATTVDRCIYSGTLDGNDGGGSGNYGGLVGYANNSADCYLTISNCLFDGKLKNSAATPGNCTFGGMIGYSNGAHVTIKNVLSIGTVTSPKAAQFFGAVKSTRSSIHNSYYQGANVNSDASTVTLNPEEATKVTDEQLASGWVATKLGSAWRQVLGTDAYPVPDDAKPIVVEITSAGYATLYNVDTDLIAPTEVGAYTAEFESTWLKLNAISGAIAAGEPVVLKGAAGFYNFAIAEGATKVEGNVLKGADEDIAATGKYILAQPEGEVVGFYKATSGTIKAGKVYLEVASDVKAFYFAGDDATGIMTLSNSTIKDESIYNIAGQRLNKMQKGINIINGKKVLK